MKKQRSNTAIAIMVEPKEIAREFARMITNDRSLHLKKILPTIQYYEWNRSRMQIMAFDDLEGLKKQYLFQGHTYAGIIEYNEIEIPSFKNEKIRLHSFPKVGGTKDPLGISMGWLLDGQVVIEVNLEK